MLDTECLPDTYIYKWYIILCIRQVFIQVAKFGVNSSDHVCYNQLLLRITSYK